VSNDARENPGRMTFDAMSKRLSRDLVVILGIKLEDGTLESIPQQLSVELILSIIHRHQKRKSKAA